MQISLNRRLYFGFALAIILVIFVCAASYIAFQKQVDESGWVTHTYQVIDRATDVREVITDMRGNRRSYRLTGDSKYLAPYTQSLAQIMPLINDLREMVKDNPVQYARIDSLKTATKELLAYWEEMPIIHAGDDPAKTNEVTRAEEALMDKEKALLNTINDEEGGLLLIREKSNQGLLGIVSNVLIWGGVLILIVVFILIYIILKEFRTRKKAEADLLENYEELEQLNAAAVEKNWLLEGNATINDSLQGSFNSIKLSQEVLTALVRYMGVPAGALYLLDEKDNNLHLTASVAIAANSQAVFTIGEGIVGNAALTKEITLIKNVPGDYWKVQSAMGHTSGKGEIACVPFWFNTELKGVIELGSFIPFSESQVSLLKTIVRNIATSIDARQASEKVDQLFGQVQEQKETLEHQQEELRQTNEELTRQAEILQASEEELKVQEEELRQINAELEEKNEAVEVARQTLSIKAKELEVTSKYKSEFLANMSHELRTPLNSVLILAKLLAENKPGNLTEKQVEYANIVHKSGSDLLKLINDILDLSKIEAGKIELHFEKVTTDFILKDIQQLFAVVAEDKQVAFTVNREDDVPESIYTDKQRLEQVVKNLLSNAFKFTPKQGSIALNVRIEKDRSFIADPTLLQAEHIVAIDVKDSGIGIPLEKQQLIFEAFQQADGSTSRKYGGTGLGLSISKELIRILGGEISVTSEENKGSTFTLYIPAGKRNVSVYKAEVNVSADNEEKEIKPLKEIDFSQLTQQTVVRDDRSDIQPSDRVMLIIEDDPSFAAILRDFAKNKKYKTIIALHGDEGLYYAQKYKPDAITLDIQIPVIDGWTVLKALKNDKILKNIPVHVISAIDDTPSKLSGAIAYLKKPVEKEDLEKAFSIIGSHVAEHAKKVIVLSGEIVKDGSLKSLLEQRNFEVECTYVTSVSEVVEKMKTIHYDCIIADIGDDIEKGVTDLHALNVASNLQDIPVIIYLDKDITPADELRLNKISPVIIRESSHAKDRLLDEMELFLYKVQETKDKPDTPAARKVSAMPLSNDVLVNKSILLVDDDMRNVFALSTALEEQKMNVVAAGDGKEALEILKKDPNIDLVLMDVMMPEMDGYEATRKIRTELKLGKLPIIALTAKAMTGDREKCIAAGASDYISKPIDTGKLFSLMRVWLSQ